MKYRLTRLHDSKSKLLMLASLEVNLATGLHDADNMVKFVANNNDSTTTAKVDAKSVAVIGDGWVVLVEQLGE